MAARCHPLYVAARIGLLALSIGGLWFALLHLALTVEEIRFANARDDAAFRQTLVGETLEAAARLDFDTAIAEALDDGDHELAGVLHAVAVRMGVPLHPELEARYAAEMSVASRAGRAARDAAIGALTGRCDTPACVAGALGTDLALPFYADLRDVGWQGFALATGGGGDEVILGLAAIGLLVPLAQPATDPLKAALRYGRRSAAFAGDLGRQVGRVVDLGGLRGWAFSRRVVTEPGGYRPFVRPDRLAPLRRAGSDLIGIGYHGGGAATSMALRHADGLADLSAHHRVAKLFGEESAGMLALLGKRVPKLAKAWRMTAPLAAKLLALSGLFAACAAAAASALSSSLAERIARRVFLRGLLGWLSRPSS